MNITNWYQAIDDFPEQYKFDLNNSRFETDKCKFFIHDQIYYHLKKIEGGEEDKITKLAQFIGKNTPITLNKSHLFYTKYVNPTKKYIRLILVADLLELEGKIYKKIVELFNQQVANNLIEKFKSMKTLKLRIDIATLIDFTFLDLNQHAIIKQVLLEKLDSSTESLSNTPKSLTPPIETLENNHSGSLEFKLENFPDYKKSTKKTSDKNENAIKIALKSHLNRIEKYKIDLLNYKITGKIKDTTVTFFSNSQIFAFLNDKIEDREDLSRRIHSTNIFVNNKGKNIFKNDNDKIKLKSIFLKAKSQKKSSKKIGFHIVVFNLSDNKNSISYVYRSKLDELFGKQNMNNIFKSIDNLPICSKFQLSEEQTCQALQITDPNHPLLEGKSKEIQQQLEKEKNQINESEKNKLQKAKRKREKFLKNIKAKNSNFSKKLKTQVISKEKEFNQPLINFIVFKDKQNSEFFNVPTDHGVLTLEIVGKNLPAEVEIQYAAWFEKNEAIDWTYAPSLDYLKSESSSICLKGINFNSSMASVGTYKLKITGKNGQSVETTFEVENNKSNI